MISVRNDQIVPQITVTKPLINNNTKNKMSATQKNNLVDYHQVMQELRAPELASPVGFDTMKVLETYKRSVDYYNSYGLDKKDNRAVKATPKDSSPTGTFWDLSMSWLLYLLLINYHIYLHNMQTNLAVIISCQVYSISSNNIRRLWVWER